ncbi:MFS transporter [Tropicimonas marinistellae]|uniref:MFS transporter n=1 Tax=Tropicimonas marinistellae TaxID=1739787 RepID=UPI00082D2E13|nr:MFS transporter [Tropicimonas marinistellae]
MDDPTPAAPQRRRLMLVAALLALFLAALEQTIIGPVMGDIAADLGGGRLLPWVATGYLMAATTTAPILGALADINGRRRALLIAVGLFVAGSVAAALARDLAVLVAARALQGAGAGGLIALPFVVVADLVPMRKRALFAAGISTIYAVSSILGPVAGGILADRLHWSAVFWLNLPLGGLVAAMILTADRTGAARRTRRVDVLGAALLSLATFATILALDTATGEAANTAATPALLAAAVLFWVSFGYRMTRAADPLVPVGVLTERTILLNAVALFCAQGTNIGLAIYLPLYWRSEFGLSATDAGLAILGFLGGVMLGPYLPPRLLLRVPRYRPILLAGASIALVGSFALAAVIRGGGSFVMLEATSFSLGIGVGILYPIFLLAVQNAARPESMGAALGVMGFMRGMGATVGASAAGLAAVAAGLDGNGGAGWPAWTLVVPAILMMIVALAACIRMPDRELDGYSSRA